MSVGQLSVGEWSFYKVLKQLLTKLFTREKHKPSKSKMDLLYNVNVQFGIY